VVDVAKRLRLVVGAIVVLFPATCGWLFRSPWIIPIIGAVFVPLYVLGKAGASTQLSDPRTRQAVLRAVPQIWLIQTVIAGIFYLIGAGAGALAHDRPVNWALDGLDLGLIVAFVLLTLPLTATVAHAENPARETMSITRTTDSNTTADGSAIVSDANGEFGTIARTITPRTFYRGWHFSRHNYTLQALTDIVDHQGNKPVRAPKRASEAMIAATEQRLGVRLPQMLREIYKVQDGGSLPTYFVPRYPGAPRDFDGWVSAFAHDYDVLNPLADLVRLHDDYVEHGNPDDPEETAGWIPGAEKLIVIASRTGYGTALDYRQGEEPGVLLFDHGNEAKEVLRFLSFEAFLAACHEIVFDHGAGNERSDEVFGGPPNPLDADRFWEKGHSGAGVTSEQWAEAGKTLGVRLPDGLLPFFKAANGGLSKFKVAVGKDGESESEPLEVFPSGPYVDPGAFLRLEHWVSLATLSDRLDFIDDRKPWRGLHDQPGKLVVISAAFDSALLLDYRKDDERPAVLAMADLDLPETAIAFPTVEDFLARLRRFGNAAAEAKNEIGDRRISTRLSDAASFWVADASIGSVDPTTVDAFIETWGFQTFGLPETISQLYATQDGGQVRFRFAAPQKVNAHGYVNADPSAKTWIDVFPGGLRPMAQWQSFEAWRAQHKLAVGQDLHDFTGRVKPTSDDADAVTLRLFVIGDHVTGSRRTITLLDMSSDYFNRNRDLLTAVHDPKTDRFRIVFGPVMVDNIYHGLHQTVRALKAEL
jgi:hypothetical protein